MKRLMLFLFVLALAGATRGSAAGRPVPENGFWVIITWETGPATTTVKFYDLKQQLIYVEHLDGVRLDGASRRVCRMLSKSLRTALVAWEGSGRMTSDQGIVAMRMK
ncbi:hypothetical protein [Puia sp.]|uniref:hypothetical protein n=1 Tax=Puia sp. TaxID=2045100 RepID=UPI002F3F0ADD